MPTLRRKSKRSKPDAPYVLTFKILARDSAFTYGAMTLTDGAVEGVVTDLGQAVEAERAARLRRECIYPICGLMPQVTSAVE